MTDAVRRTPNPPRDDHVEIIVPVAQAGSGATNPGALVSPGAGNGRDDLRARLIERVTRELGERTDLCAYVDVDVVDDRLSDVVAAMVDVVLAAGWRPPLADTLSPWDAYREAYNEFRRDVPSWKAHFTAHHMHALEAALRVYNPSDPAMVAESRAAVEEFERVEAERDEARAKLDQVRTAIAPFRNLGQGDVFDRIRAIVGEVQP